MRADLQNISDKINAQMIFDFLNELGAEPEFQPNGNIKAITICHGGDSHKLEWSPIYGFHCWTNCGAMNIFSLFMNIYTLDFGKSVNKVKQVFNVNDFSFGFKEHTSVIDNDLNPIKALKKKTIEDIDLKVFDDKVLNSFYPGVPQSWVDEGITIEGASQFNIRQDPLDQRTIIPQYNMNGDLIGIRARNFSKESLDRGFKYVPIKYNGIDYRFLTGQNLYGLNVNKENIKKYKYAIVFEGEKSVIKMNSWYNDSTAIAVNGSNFTEYQLAILKTFNLDRIYFAFDKDFVGAYASRPYLEKIKSVVSKAKGVLGDVYLIWDTKGLLGLKDSPVDQGKEVFEQLKKGAFKLK